MKHLVFSAILALGLSASHASDDATLGGGAAKDKPLEVAKAAAEVCKEEYNNQAKLPNAKSKAQQNADFTNCLVQNTEKNSWIKNTKVSVNLKVIDSEYNGDFQFEGVVPITEKEDSALFVQPGFILSLHSEGRTSLDSGLGVVYRFVFADGILGLNAFYDRSDVFDDGSPGGNSFAHQRGSVGADYQSGKNHWSVNYYFPITGWVSVDEFYQEHALGGVELRYERLLNERFSVHGSLTRWDSKTSEDRTNPAAGVEYKLNCEMTIGTELEYDSQSDNVSAMFTFGYRWGGKKRSTKDCLKQEFANSGSNLWKRVEREGKIRYERARKSVRLNVSDKSVDPGVEFSYTISDKDFSSVKKGETPNVMVTSMPEWLSYDRESRVFSGTPEEIGVYRVAGTAFLVGGALSSSWSFKITVGEEKEAKEEEAKEEEARTPLALTIPAQSLEIGLAFSYTLQDGDIPGLREGESPTIEVTEASAAEVSYDPDSRTFSSAAGVDEGEHTVKGTIIADGREEAEWSFTLTVSGTPTIMLNIADQTAIGDQSFSYTVKDSDITGLPPGVEPVIRVTNIDRSTTTLRASGLGSVNSFVTTSNGVSTFRSSGDISVPSACSSSGNCYYDISGTINAPGAIQSNWKFKILIVPLPPITLTLATQEVKSGESLVYTIKKSDISGLPEGATPDITFIGSTRSPQDLSYANAGGGRSFKKTKNQGASDIGDTTFTFDTGALTLPAGASSGHVVLSGAINARGAGETSWTFRINVVR